MSDRPAPSPEDEDLGEIEEIEVDDGAGDGAAGEAEPDADGETGDSGDAGEAEAEEDVEQPRRGGGAATPRNLRRRAQEAERQLAAERAERAADRARLQALESRVASDPAAQRRAAEQEQEALARMTPDEQARYFYDKGRHEVATAFQAMQNDNAERFDKLSYDTAARSSTIHQRYADRVEEVLRAERAGGRNPPREVILKFLVGDDAMRKATAAAPGQRRAAAARVAGQAGRPGGARGDAPRSRERNPDAADEALLRGIKVSDL